MTVMANAPFRPPPAAGAEPVTTSFRRALDLHDNETAFDYTPVRKSIRIHGHSTTIRLEAAFWHVLEELAERENRSLPAMIASIHHHCPVERNNLASCLRVFCLTYVIGNTND